MSDSGAFCPRCGGPVDSDGPVGDPAGGHAKLCADCYFEEFDLLDVPDRIELPVCARCGAVERGKRWVDVGAEDYADVAVDAVSEALSVHVDAEDVAWQVATESVDETTVRVHVLVSGVVRGRYVEEEVTVPVKLARGTCDRCGLIAGDYYAATVQVRANDRTPDDDERRGAREIAREFVADREKRGDREAFISEIAETDEGLDVRVSTTGLGRAIAERIATRFGGQVSESRRLITEDGDGNRVYRMAYAVRLPRYRPGEVIDPGDDEGPVLVRSVRGNLKGRRLTTGEQYEADYEDGDAPEATRLGTRAQSQETALVAVEDDRAVQVLDPETYETVTIARPDYLDPEADTVSVLKSRAGLHVLPEDGSGDGNGDGTV